MSNLRIVIVYVMFTAFAAREKARAARLVELIAVVATEQASRLFLWTTQGKATWTGRGQWRGVSFHRLRKHTRFGKCPGRAAATLD